MATRINLDGVTAFDITGATAPAVAAGIVSFTVASTAMAIDDQTGASYTLALTDNNAYVRMNNASPNTVTVPPNSSVAFPIGSKVMIRQVGAGVTTIVAGGGVTINATSLVLAGQNTTVAVVKVATDTWDLV